MSEGRRGTDTTPAKAAFLAAVPLFDGIPTEELAELAQVLHRRELAAGEVLWQEGGEATGMVLIVDGRVALSLALPGERAVQLTSVGRAEILGEVPLVDGGRHSATARAIEPTSVLVLR